ncbi:hypothetical protein [Crocosphaera chwakensis]|uniref:hypothetical protein n=1 Tax=Crocosphaera chwakensis TaxID=2546361 RepID=UPI00055B935F|nr:hypothetical protein [Crocosphaera chwakensis]
MTKRRILQEENEAIQKRQVSPIKDLKFILGLVLILGIASFPIIFYGIFGFGDCPIMSTVNQCSSFRQTVAEYLFFYTVIYTIIFPFYVLVIMLLLLFILINFIIKNK